jgi:hypothetical protein
MNAARARRRGTYPGKRNAVATSLVVISDSNHACTWVGEVKKL